MKASKTICELPSIRTNLIEQSLATRHGMPAPRQRRVFSKRIHLAKFKRVAQSILNEIPRYNSGQTSVAGDMGVIRTSQWIGILGQTNQCAATVSRTTSDGDVLLAVCLLNRSKAPPLVRSNSDLMQVALTLHQLRPGARLLNRRQQQRQQDCNHGQHDKNLNQGDASPMTSLSHTPCSKMRTDHRTAILPNYQLWECHTAGHAVLKTFGRTRLTVPSGGMRSISFLTMSSGRTPSASALKLVRMRCRRTGAATDCTSSIPA